MIIIFNAKTAVDTVFPYLNFFTSTYKWDLQDTNSSIINETDSQNLAQIYSTDTRWIEIQWSNDFEVANRVAPSYSMQRSNPQGPAAADHYLNEFPKPMVKT